MGNKNSFSLFGHDILKKYDDRYIAFLAIIASLTNTEGYCYASNEYFSENVYNMTKKKIDRRLDYLEKNKLIVRYFRIGKDQNENIKAKRIILLSDVAYGSYKLINSKLSQPKKPKGDWLTIDEYKDRIRTDNKQFKTINNEDVFNEENHNDFINEHSNEHDDLSRLSGDELVKAVDKLFYG